MIKLDTVTLHKFLRTNDKRVANLGQLLPAHKQAVVVLHQWVQKNFEKEGGMHEEGKYKWMPSQRAMREDGKTLQDRGNLRRNWDLKSSNAKGQLKSKTPYSADHEFGVGTPQRKIFPTVRQGKKILMPVYQRYFNEKVINA